MTKTTISVGGMSCNHCVNHVKNALTDIVGVNAVSVNLETGSAEIEHEESVKLEQMHDAILEAGYTVV